MNDLENMIREMLRDDALGAPFVLEAPPRMRPRIRRRQVARVVVGSFVALGLVLGTVGVLRGLTPRLGTERGGETHDCSAFDGGPVGTGPVVSIASGADPVGGEWKLTARDVCGVRDEVLIGFGFEQSGGGGGGGFQPLGDKDIRTMYLTGPVDGEEAKLPLNVVGLVSARTDRVELQLRDGRSFLAEVHPVPARFVGPAQVFLVLVQSTVDLDGYVVAYDASGNVLQREPVGLSREPRGSTPEVDLVWLNLRRTRDAISSFYLEQGSFTSLAKSLTVEGIVLNTLERAIPGEISIRGVSQRELVLVGATPSGDVYCMGVSHGRANHSGFRYRFGRIDAQTHEECSGGW